MVHALKLKLHANQFQTFQTCTPNKIKVNIMSSQPNKEQILNLFFKASSQKATEVRN
jgi:hypothetical protein